MRQRLRKLLNGGAVRFDAVTDGRAMGIDFIAFVKVSVVPKHLEAFLRTCAEFEDVWYLAALSGRFNVLAGCARRTRSTRCTSSTAVCGPSTGSTRIEVRQVSRRDQAATTTRSSCSGDSAQRNAGPSCDGRGTAIRNSAAARRPARGGSGDLGRRCPGGDRIRDLPTRSPRTGPSPE